jgi:hypothetical protein
MQTNNRRQSQHIPAANANGACATNTHRNISLLLIACIILFVLYARAAVSPYAKQDHNKFYPLTPQPSQQKKIKS